MDLKTLVVALEDAVTGAGAQLLHFLSNPDVETAAKVAESVAAVVVPEASPILGVIDAVMEADSAPVSVHTITQGDGQQGLLGATPMHHELEGMLGGFVAFVEKPENQALLGRLVQAILPAKADDLLSRLVSLEEKIGGIASQVQTITAGAAALVPAAAPDAGGLAQAVEGFNKNVLGATGNGATAAATDGPAAGDAPETLAAAGGRARARARPSADAA